MTVGDLIALLEELPRDTKVLVHAFHESELVDAADLKSLDAKQHFGPRHGGRFFDAENDIDGSFPAVVLE
ncbi:hypothetical protein [Duganella vulcania]|uniref:Uncharacterized protein n=1 Tax=Duganella vulcania TaxID=2692166 RepID=A0A845GER8_9BURK|nr:hypothetical protein [Duganella vulcania]MYM92401.1 hypothetical protein [Duganella vulcania]